MATRVRKTVYLTREQAERVKLHARALGVSESEVVRRAVDADLCRHVSGGTNPAALDKALEFSRKRASMGPLTGKRTWTRDDLYEERLARYARR